MENIRILLVDSDDVFLRNCTDYLSVNGYRSLEVRSDCRPPEIERIHDFDCAVIELCDLIDTGLHSIMTVPLSSVILTCRHHTIETERLARSLRPSVYLVKPVSFADILSVLFRIAEMKERLQLICEYGLFGSRSGDE